MAKMDIHKARLRRRRKRRAKRHVEEHEKKAAVAAKKKLKMEKSFMKLNSFLMAKNMKRNLMKRES